MTEPTDRWRCALAARERQDPLVGTAVPAPRWFLVEHPGPWQRTAAGTAPLDTVATELPALLEGHGARLQLIRRHGRRTGSGAEDGRRGVALVDCRTARVHWSTWQTPQDLLALAARMPDLLAAAPPCDDPLVLVCAHGRKDVCCAIDGRLTARVLDDLLPGMVWETTHLGGDRFAANVTFLPDGTMYGRVDGTSAPDLAIAHLDGLADLTRWRGRSLWDPAAQAAAADVLATLDTPRWRDLDPPRVTPDGADTWRVEIDVDGRTHRRTVTRSWAPRRRLTCADTTEKTVAVWTAAR